ncbi:C40 family peptidase [Streptomyces sp. CBMA29]|uniref:C40 family peptidase n=1 Tax=Streptomyces sp. CBMA29 TaxID=1896314 RepID=UPI001661C115|nr:C40 family peptidase [Streptomyces sp. CBMA29]
MSASAQAQWQYRRDQQQRMYTSGLADAQNAHTSARAAAQRAHGLAEARWQNQQATYSRQLSARGMTQARADAINARANISNLQYRASTDLRDQRVSAADATFTRSRDALNAQRDRLDFQYRNSLDRIAERQATSGTPSAAALRAQTKPIRAAAAAAATTVTGAMGRYGTSIRDFNSGVDQYGRLVSLYGGFGTGSFTGRYGDRAERATGQGFRSGFQNVATSDSDLFTGMAALYRQNSFSNMPTMQRAAAASALVSPEMGIAGAAQLQAQMGTARAYYAGQMFGLAPSISPGGGKATPQQTFASLFSQVSPRNLGQLTTEQMKAMLAQGGSLQTTLENYGNAAGIGSEGIQSAADYLTLSNRLRTKNKNMSQSDVDTLLANAAKSGKTGDKARDTLKDAAPGVAESYLDAQRRAEGAKREGKLDSSASYITAAISSANTLIDIRELLKPVMEPLRKFLAQFSGALEGGGPLGLANQVGHYVPGYDGTKSALKWTGSAISGIFGGDSGAPKSRQGGSGPQVSASGSGSPQAAQAIGFAEKQLGKPYVFGAEGPDSWDCSSLTQAAYRSIGVNIPRTTYRQINSGKEVPVKDALPGDLLFYPDLSHVVMAIGGGQVIQAPHSGDVVKISALDPNLYGRARRIVGSVGTLADTLSDSSGDRAGTQTSTGTQTSATGAGGAYGSTEEIDALAAALAGGGGSVQQTTSTGASPSTQNTVSKGASIPAGPSNPKGNQALGKSLAASVYGWTGREWDALYQLWEHESGWNEKAVNPSSQAWGIPQALPGSKMASAGPDWKTSAATQIRWGLGYIHDRYGDPEKAWAFWQNPKGSPAGSSVHWYRSGAFEIPDDQDARLHKGEMVLEKNTAHTVRQALLKDSLRTSDPAARNSGGGTGSSAVHLNFDAGSIVITMQPGATASGARQAATQFVDFVTADDRVRKMMGGY